MLGLVSKIMGASHQTYMSHDVVMMHIMKIFYWLVLHALERYVTGILGCECPIK